MTKILNFPNKIDVNFPSTMEEAQDHVTEVRRTYCDEVGTDALDAALTVFANYGVQVRPNGTAIKDLVFLEEAIKAILYRNKNVPHPFHEMIEKSIVLPEETEAKIEELIKDSVDLI